MDSPSASTLPGRFDPVRLLLSSSGRMGRGPFLAAVLAQAAVFALFEAAVHGPAHRLSAWAVHLPLLFSAACVLSKRLHDRGRAGWWAAAPLWAFAVAWPAPHGVFGVVAVLILVLCAIELGARPGRSGFNRFGPPG